MSCHFGFDEVRVFLHVRDVSVAEEAVDGFVVDLVLGGG